MRFSKLENGEHFRLKAIKEDHVFFKEDSYTGISIQGNVFEIGESFYFQPEEKVEKVEKNYG